MAETTEALAMREKYWAEIDAPEKCQRLRLQVKRLQQELIEMQKILSDLQHHSHMPDGRLMLPFCSGPQPSTWHVDMKDDEYF
jgi:hypothetical protein